MNNNFEEKQYLNLIQNILDNGDYIESRNGNIYSIFGNMMRFSLKNKTIPILTTKKTAHKTCLKELLWFISGNTSNEELTKQKVYIWNDNSSREFLDSRGLTEYDEGDLGPVYGFQWRHFNAPYVDCNTNYENQGIDQLQNVIDLLKDPKSRHSRRIILSAWNPCQLDKMALPPCHILAQFHVSSNNELSCSLYQRSGDVGLGVPFNIASYSFLTHLIAHHCGLDVKDFVYFLGNAHIYEEHIEKLKEQLNNKCYDFPKINILNKYENINDYTIDDFKIINYKCGDKINMVMKA
ncbi:thymidylate synthase [bacterium]|nr:thymidylate synthase [bacterium]|tara:strand:- start:2033 stop:2914 length:882 start_codon:yes stop_codon:yes gene_type:complete